MDGREWTKNFFFLKRVSPSISPPATTGHFWPPIRTALFYVKCNFAESFSKAIWSLQTVFYPFCVYVSVHVFVQSDSACNWFGVNASSCSFVFQTESPFWVQLKRPAKKRLALVQLHSRQLETVIFPGQHMRSASTYMCIRCRGRANLGQWAMAADISLSVHILHICNNT